MERFFDCLYHDKPPGYILIWSMGEKKISTWHATVETAIQQAKTDKCNIYVGCGLSETHRASNERCPANEIIGIPGVWIDIDFMSDSHKKTNLPETPEKALEILNTFPIKPNILVNSGHGYQAWWIFKKFLLFKNDQERNDGAMLVQTFNNTLADMARHMGYDMDHTHDLSRVMRIPGTINYKGEPIDVTLDNLQLDYPETHDFVAAISNYRLSHLDIMSAIPKRPVEPQKMIKSGEFVLTSDAMYPKLKFDNLFEMDPKFKATWNRQRKDLKDQSASSYTMALANIAFAMDWEKQEVVDLLIAWRRQHHEDLKLRVDWYARTLNKAYSVIEDRLAMEKMESIEAELADANPEDRYALIEESLQAVSKVLGINIIEIVQYMIDPPEFKLVTEKGSIHLGDVSFLTNQYKLRDKISAVAHHYMPSFKQERWEPIARSLLNAITMKYVGDESTNKGMVRSWLQTYLEYNDPLYDPDNAAQLYRPYFYDKSLWLFATDFRVFLDVHFKERINPKLLGILLREYGGKPVQENYRDGEKWISKRVWSFPIAMDKIMFDQFLKYDMMSSDETDFRFPRLIANN